LTTFSTRNKLKRTKTNIKKHIRTKGDISVLAKERLSMMYKMILANSSVTIEELSQTFDVTPMTVRRDLEKLSDMHTNVVRCHGGAMLATEVNIEENFENKRVLNVDDKARIASKAFSMISDHDTIYLDAGTTILELAKLIAVSNLSLTVVTNDLATSQLLIPSKSEVLLTGGTIQKSTGCLVGSIAEEMISKMRFKVAFMGATAINESFEVLTPSIEKRTMKPAVLRSAAKSYLLVDEDKFGKYSTYVIYSLKDFTGVITTRVFSKTEKNEMEEFGARIIEV